MVGLCINFSAFSNVTIIQSYVIGNRFGWPYCFDKKIKEPQKWQKNTKVTVYQLLVI